MRKRLRQSYKAFAELSSCAKMVCRGAPWPWYEKCIDKKTYPREKRRLSIDMHS